MSKPFWAKFGSGDPRTNTGLTPTFIIFETAAGGTLSPPGITETIVGTGLYQFDYGTTQSIIFTLDGGSALSATDRYITGVLDPIQFVDQAAGYATDSYGSTSVDPGTFFGYFRRLQELFEGDATFTKSTGIWQVFNRGSTTLLRTKTLTNSTTSATKTGV